MRRRESNRSWQSRHCATSATFCGHSLTHSTLLMLNRDGRRRGGTEQDRMVLFPEGAIRLQGTGLQILERCDGQRTFGQIIEELQAQFSVADPAKVRADISQFLEQLQHKRIVDY